MSVFIGRDLGEFFEGLFESGLVAVHEMLGAAEALDAVEVVAEGIGGGNKILKGNILIVLDDFRQTANLDAGKGDLVEKLPFDICIQAISFGGGEEPP